MFGGTFSKFNCDLTELLKRNRYLDFLNYILLPYCNKGQNFTNKTGIILRTNAHLLSNTDGCLFVCALPTCRTLREQASVHTRPSLTRSATRKRQITTSRNSGISRSLIRWEKRKRKERKVRWTKKEQSY